MAIQRPGSQTQVNNNNHVNKNKRKIYQKSWFWMALVVVVSLVGSIVYYIAMGGSDGIQQHQIQKKILKQRNSADNYLGKSDINFDLPSVETVIQDTKNNFDDKTYRDIKNYDSVHNFFVKKYGKTADELIESGLLISIDMTPNEMSNMKINIAQAINQKNFVSGFAQYNIKINIDNGSYQKHQNYLNIEGSSEGNGAYPVLQANKSGNYNWQTIDDHKVSTPSVIGMPVKFLTPKVQTGDTASALHVIVVTFIKANEGDKISDIKEVASKLKISGEDGNAQTLNSNLFQQQYKELSFFKYVSKADFNNSTKVVADSVIPVAYSLRIDGLDGDSTTVKLNGKSYQLSPNYINDAQTEITGLKIP